MSKAGDIVENPVTGERAVARVGTEESGGELLEVDLYVHPSGAVAGEHVHPAIEEAFTVTRGQIGFRTAGDESIAELNKRLVVRPVWRTTGGMQERKRRTSSSRSDPDLGSRRWRKTSTASLRTARRTPRGCQTSFKAPSWPESLRT